MGLNAERPDHRGHRRHHQVVADHAPHQQHEQQERQQRHVRVPRIDSGAQTHPTQEPDHAERGDRSEDGAATPDGHRSDARRAGRAQQTAGQQHPVVAEQVLGGGDQPEQRWSGMRPTPPRPGAHQRGVRSSDVGDAQDLDGLVSTGDPVDADHREGGRQGRRRGDDDDGDPQHQLAPIGSGRDQLVRVTPTASSDHGRGIGDRDACRHDGTDYRRSPSRRGQWSGPHVCRGRRCGCRRAGSPGR